MHTQYHNLSLLLSQNNPFLPRQHRKRILISAKICHLLTLKNCFALPFDSISIILHKIIDTSFMYNFALKYSKNHLIKF